jgi:hypothetical protein
MKVIIAGSRGITDEQTIFNAIKNSGFEITEVVSGGAIGVDKFGEKYANRYDIPLKVFLPDWEKKKSAAGIIRNAEMARYADALIAVWDGESKGTKNMIEVAERKGLKVYVWKIQQNSTTKSSKRRLARAQ